MKIKQTGVKYKNNIFIDWEEIHSKICEIPLTKILGKYLDVKEKKTSAVALCPFHANTKIGCFSINNQKGVWKCFGCGMGGNAIGFVSNFNNISYFEAIIMIAKQYGFIPENYEPKNISKSEQKKQEKILIEKDIESALSYEESVKSDINTLNCVYKVFIDTINPRLEKKDFNYLRNRGLSESQIKNGKYFTMPTYSVKFMEKFTENLELEGLDSDIVLKSIPGFYFNTKTNLYEFSYMAGIGFPIRNAFNKILAIHYRTNIENCKYLWFSSANANLKEDYYKWGTSSGSPVDVVYPTRYLNSDIVEKKHRLFLTEGRFKAEALAEKCLATSLSIQGVSNWKNFIDEIDRVISVLKYRELNPKLNVTEICLAFDSDMCQNANVLKFTNELVKSLKLVKSNLEINVFIWDVNFGKGIDDIIYNNLAKHIKKISSDEFINNFEKMDKAIFKAYKNNINNLDKSFLALNNCKNTDNDKKMRLKAKKQTQDVLREYFENIFLK